MNRQSIVDYLINDKSSPNSEGSFHVWLYHPFVLCDVAFKTSLHHFSALFPSLDGFLCSLFSSWVFGKDVRSKVFHFHSKPSFFGSMHLRLFPPTFDWSKTKEIFRTNFIHSQIVSSLTRSKRPKGVPSQKLLMVILSKKFVTIEGLFL